jgi:hypothetical protein
MSACDCADCVRAGCVEPPVKPPGAPALLHGKALQRYYDERDQRRAIFDKLKADLKAKGLRAQRGDEPR